MKHHTHKTKESQCAACQTKALVKVTPGRKKELGTGKIIDGKLNAISVARGAKMSAFLSIYSVTGSFGASCSQLSLKPSTVKYWISNDPIFAAKYADAQSLFVGKLEAAAIDRAINGVKKTVASAGQYIGEDTVYPEALTMFLLRANDREKYSDGRRGMSAEVGVDKEGNKYFKVYEGFDPDKV